MKHNFFDIFHGVGFPEKKKNSGLISLKSNTVIMGTFNSIKNGTFS